MTIRVERILQFFRVPEQVGLRVQIHRKLLFSQSISFRKVPYTNLNLEVPGSSLSEIHRFA